MTLFSLAELEAALSLVRSVMPPTPQYAWPLFAQRTGAQVWVKHENHTPIGAFKIRGGVTYLDALKRSGRQFSGVVTATRGNHGQSIALAAARAGLPCTIFVPRGNSREKNTAMQAFGAELIVIGSDFRCLSAARGRVRRPARLSLRALVPRRSGQGGRHLCARAVSGRRRSRYVYAPIGMGSGICGLIAVRDLSGLRRRSSAWSPTHAPAVALYGRAGAVANTNAADTFADGMACRVPEGGALDIIAGCSPRGARHGRRDRRSDAACPEDTHNVAEGAGAAPLAALLKERSVCGTSASA